MVARPPSEPVDVERLGVEVLAGDRGGLAKAITLLESMAPWHIEPARRLLERLERAGRRGRRVGVTGPPGAGKSTLIDALGSRWMASGRRVAVLAVDPSSASQGGSILGDRPRMGALAAAGAFIRASPSRCVLGGVTDGTRGAIVACEAAGYDDVVVETVGVGQSEIAVARLVDIVLLLAPPGAGDELQGMKRGVLEVADVVAVTKADGERRALAERARADLVGALGLSRRARPLAEVVLVSVVEPASLDDLSRVLGAIGEEGAPRARDRDRLRAIAWREEFHAAVLAEFFARPHIAARRVALEDEGARGGLSPSQAARQLLRD